MPTSEVALTLSTPQISGRAVTINGIAGSNNGTITRIHWNWGDGTSEDVFSPAGHTYSAPGTYTVTVTADDDLGASANRSATVVIVPPCYFLGLDVLDGPGGLGASLPNCPNDLYKAGTVVNLTASPGEGWRVASWEDTDNDSSTSTSNTVTMDGNKSVCVRLEPIVPPTIPLPAEACALAATS